MNKYLDSYFNIIKRFIPKPPESSSIGIDIGLNECKMVEVKKEGNDYKLIHWSIESFLDENLSSAIQTVVELSKSQNKNIQTALCGKGTLIRYIDMPRMSLDELKSSFALEADKYFPFAQDQIYTDCYILNPQGKEKNMAVMAAAATKEMVDGRMKLLSEIGIQSDFVGINSVALANVINILGIEIEGSEEKDFTFAIFNIGEAVSNVTIFNSTLPQFSRDIFIGSREFVKRISNALGVKPQEAEKLIADPGKKAEEVLNACESSLMNVVQELRLSFDYFSTEKNREVGRLFLTGDGSLMKGVEDYLAKNLDVNVQQWNPLQALPLDDNISADDINKNSHKLGVALGLALYSYD